LDSGAGGSVSACFGLLKRGVAGGDETLQRARFELEWAFFNVAKAIDTLARVRKGLSTAGAESNKLVSAADTDDTLALQTNSGN